MDSFTYKEGNLYCDNISISSLSDLKTPFYLYSWNTFADHYLRFRDSFSEINPTICFSIKTCNNLGLIKRLVKLGAGIDTVTGGEIFLAQKAGADMSKVVFAGVGKTVDEIDFAIDSGVGLFNVESFQEFEVIESRLKHKNRTANAALRINPDVTDEKTHEKTQTGQKGSKFGVDFDKVLDFFNKFGKNEHLRLNGLHFHLGSPIYSPAPYVKASEVAKKLIHDLRDKGINIKHLDLGGGYPADYGTEPPANWKHFADEIALPLKPLVDEGVGIILEPGRTISANASVLVAEVQYVKNAGGRNIAIIDTGMNHLIRYAMYEAEHFIWPCSVPNSDAPKNRRLDQNWEGLVKYDIVGPICESSDYLARDRFLPPLKRGDRIAIFSAGAYGIVMASQYNALPRPSEILVEDDQLKVIREAETYSDLLLHQLSERTISK